MKISLDQKSELDIKYCCEHIIIPNKHRIISLRMSNSIRIDEFFTHCIINETFNRLESVNLSCRKTSDLMATLFYLKSLPRLFALTIDLEQYITSGINLNDIYRLILCLPFLKYNSLISTDYSLKNLLPVAINERLSNIEYLVMKHSCSVNALMSIFNYTPRLYYLTCQKLYKLDDNKPFIWSSFSSDSEEPESDYESEQFDRNYGSKVLTMLLPNLTYLSIQRCTLKFEELEKFLKICSQLKALYIGQFFNGKNVYPDQWQQLILQNMPQLRKCDLKCPLITDEYLTSNQSNLFIHHLTSQFWIERGWMIEFTIKQHAIYYLILSNSMQIFPPSIQTDQDVFSIEWGKSDTDKFSLLLLEIQFTSLFISHNDLSIGDIVKIIGLLPNLNSLKVSSLSLEDLNSLSIEDAENLRLVSINNRITRVHQPMKFCLMNFLIGLCPRMEYFELARLGQKNHKKFVQHILMETITHIRYLRLLCFRVFNANDEMIYDLQKMIDSKKLLSKYLIRRVDNMITLQWNVE